MHSTTQPACPTEPLSPKAELKAAYKALVDGEADANNRLARAAIPLVKRMAKDRRWVMQCYNSQFRQDMEDTAMSALGECIGRLQTQLKAGKPLKCEIQTYIRRSIRNATMRHSLEAGLKPKPSADTQLRWRRNLAKVYDQLEFNERAAVTREERLTKLKALQAPAEIVETEEALLDKALSELTTLDAKATQLETDMRVYCPCI